MLPRRVVLAVQHQGMSWSHCPGVLLLHTCMSPHTRPHPTHMHRLQEQRSGGLSLLAVGLQRVCQRPARALW